MKHVLVTGGAGFIGSHLTERMLSLGWRVTVVDNFDRFYDPAVKEENLRGFAREAGFRLHRADICDMRALEPLAAGDYDAVVHLAARAGVRPSIEDPVLYQRVNGLGTQNMLEFARLAGVRQFVFASSSSVYGVNPRTPWIEDDRVLEPISPYAATKVAGELLGHVYTHLYGIRFLALRFFTVYGPRQRPDLAIHKMARLLLAGRPIPIFGDGTTRRDYTYVDDIVDGVLGAIAYRRSPYEIVNLGNNHTVGLLEMVRELERALGVEARLEFQPEQPGDVPQTWADLAKAGRLFGYAPRVTFAEGVDRFAGWLAAERTLAKAS
jgi:UDP-glucuronate 4-epimerase